MADTSRQDKWWDDPLSAGAAIVLAMVTSISVGQPRELADSLDRYLHPGLVAASACVLAVLFADWFVPTWPRVWGGLAAFTLLVASAATAFYAHDAIGRAVSESDGDLPLGASVFGWAIGALAVLAGCKLALLVITFSSDRLADRRQAPSLRTGVLPLPGQEAFATKVAARCRVCEPAGFKLVPIVGRWGDGKSYILSLIEDDLERSGISVLRVNVWQSETDPRFYESLVRDLYATEPFTRRFGWLRRPFGIALTDVIRWRPSSLKVGLLQSEVEVTLAHQPPALPYARALGRDLRAKARSDSPSVVLVVDEIERATPIAAQTALSVLRRAFDEPGVVVLLSYVEENVHFNTFNPERGLLDDLRGIFFSIVDHERQLEAANLAHPPAAGGSSRPEDHGPSDSLNHRSALDHLTRIEALSSTGSGDLPRRLSDSWQERAAVTSDVYLLDVYMAWPDAKKRSIQRRAAEKFLHGGALDVPKLIPDDVAQLYLKSEGLREISNLLTSSEAAALMTQEGQESVRTQVVAAITALNSGTSIGLAADEPPPIRHLRNTFDEVLPRTVLRMRREQPDAEINLGQIAALAAILYRAAQLKAGA